MWLTAYFLGTLSCLKKEIKYSITDATHHSYNPDIVNQSLVSDNSIVYVYAVHMTSEDK